MKKLLIHSNNTSFNQIELFPISQQFVFDVDFDKDIDFYIEENLTEGDLRRKLEEAEIVFIKVALSQNYLEYLGIRLAYHIRLTKKLGAKVHIPIVFIAEEGIQFLGLSCAEPSILFTRGIYLIRESIEDYLKIIKWYADGKIKSLTDYLSFVKVINIYPPANYQSHHFITNEWSILRWSKVLAIKNDNKLLQGVKKNIESLLYYKYLQSKYPIAGEPDGAKFEISGKGKVLYIDDEWNKGWEVVLNKFASHSTIVFETFRNDFTDMSPNAILEECKKEVQSSNPDVVLLDLRLSDFDFRNNLKSKELTGYKVLEAIKAINPGIQVLIFTASNKVWNFTELQNAGAADFILKESPELSEDPEYSKNTIRKLASSLSTALKMSFLKRVHIKMKEIETLAPVSENTEEAEFRIRLVSKLDIAFKLLINTKYATKNFNYAYLQLFQIIEDFGNLSYVFKESDDCYVCVNDKFVLVRKTLNDQWETAVKFENGKYKLQHDIIKRNPNEKSRRLDTNYKVSAIMIFRLGFESSSYLRWTEIYSIRNTKAAHFSIDDSLDEEDIITILNFIGEFISNAKQKETNHNKGLKEKSIEESLELLKGRFKSR